MSAETIYGIIISLTALVIIMVTGTAAYSTGLKDQQSADIKCATLYSMSTPDIAIKKFPGCAQLINAIQGK